MPLADYQAMKESIEQLAMYVKHQMEKDMAQEAARAAPRKKKKAKRKNLAPIPFPILGNRVNRREPLEMLDRTSP